ncbi:hypothetical protein CONPUDRAFT_168183 [Coniophora puteana RWD-64-598 SS2]|uniref:P-loop containing nucleoside triphosphate hydrolase protein n=1 Tax=Coniophora puteana (strain RWD-64-598) TaxID=741705 RepID=A0A5M3MD66_CONPW|nr:uncharacterized protein CONPUDRAFT_168183 [Coniophora puteana RWD-64-598 SS2]EIW77192.1 hypothetical protein CONPUDRAFT_168183 [Coniophora puteana RWD-64-598 SS2]
MAPSKPSAELVALAKEQLRLPARAPDSALPQSYIEELVKHASIQPLDSHFRITLEPKRGYGTIKCLEEGCGIPIPLGPRSGVSDGGKKHGFGSLKNYRVHVSTSATHKAARHRRTKPMKADPTGTSTSSTKSLVKRGSLLDALDGSQRHSLSKPLNKNQPEGKSNSRKRPSSTFPLDQETENYSTPPSPPKRPKVDSALPFAHVDTNTQSHVYSSPDAPREHHNTKTKIATAGEASAALTKAQSTLDSTQAEITQLQAKRQRTATDDGRLGVLWPQKWKLVPEVQRLQSLVTTLTPIPPKTSTSGVLPTSSAGSSKRMLAPVPATVTKQEASQSVAAIRGGVHSDVPSVKREDVATSISAPPAYLKAEQGVKKEEPPSLNEPPLLPPNIPHHYKSEYNNDAMKTDDDSDSEEENIYDLGRSYATTFANPEDLNQFLLSAGNAEQFEGNESVDNALQRLGLRAQHEHLPGMTISLLAHQVIGVAWALDREKHRDKGGCLADDMGLGKTVQMISVMVSNRGDDPARKTNLIVAPTALLDQWAMEIETKTDCGMKCLIYHGSSKPRKRSELQKYDVVLTTYQTLALEWPDPEADEKEKRKMAKAKKKDNWIVSDSDDGGTSRAKPKKKKQRGLLFDMDWYRVILDEAQYIRNRSTRGSRCVTDLDSVYRWCLTGTPIVNGLSDAYAIFRFLKIRPWYDWAEFRGHIAKYEKTRVNLATTRLQAIFKVMLLRRKKDSTLDGKKLVDLRPKVIELEKLEFGQEEADIYKMVEARSQATFNRFLRAGTVLKNYHQVLVLLLRLRQICVHPALIQEDGHALVLHDDTVYKRSAKEERARAAEAIGHGFVKSLRAKFKASMEERMEAEKESADAMIDADMECPICTDTFTDAVVTACSHSFCRECLVDILNRPLAQGNDDSGPKYKSNERPCPTCCSPVSGDKIFSREAFEPSEEELNGTAARSSSPIPAEVDSDEEIEGILSVPSRNIRRSSRGNAKRRASYAYDSEDDSEHGDEDDDLSDFIVHSDEDEDEKDARMALKKRRPRRRAMVIDSDDSDEEIIIAPKKPAPAKEISPGDTQDVQMMPRFLPSTKMKKMMEYLLRWAEEHPDDKVIVISQWTEALGLVSNYLLENHITHVKYQGNMSRALRDATVRAFQSRDKARVLLMSLKCGGVGLNLTRANRVISLDLGWSEAIEAQAFDRAHRLGQLKDVVVQRLVIANTVEDRVLALQERKRSLADGSLGEGSGKKIGRMSVRELASLFGLDHRGNVL